MRLHHDFRLNGLSHSKETLIEISESYLASKSDNRSQTGKFILDWFDENDYIKVYTSGSTGTPNQTF